jgi:PD-(D/E)XK nuclease superfamily
MNKTPQSNKYGIVRPDLSAHFDHSMVKLPNLKDQIIGGKRFYQVPGEGAPVWYPSVTTVTGWRDRDKWKKWREENAAKSKRILERGKQFHLTMESYLSNKDLIQELFGRPDLEAMFLQMKPRVDAFVNNIHGLEVPLYSKLMRLAGRTDCVAEFNGKLSIIDFKTAERMKDTFMCHDYFIQATAYAIMYQECTKIPVNQIVIMMVSAEGEEQAFVESPKKFVPELKERIDEFYAEFSPDQLVEEIKDGHAN